MPPADAIAEDEVVASVTDNGAFTSVPFPVGVPDDNGLATM